MTLEELIMEDLKTAMRDKNEAAKRGIRAIKAAILLAKTDGSGQEVNQEREIQILQKLVKQRRESLAQYQSAGRADLAAQEAFEIDLIQSYLPAPLVEAELEALIGEAIAATGAQSVRDMGKVMAILREQAQGRADMAAISARIKARFGG